MRKVNYICFEPQDTEKNSKQLQRTLSLKFSGKIRLHYTEYVGNIYEHFLSTRRYTKRCVYIP